MREVILRERDGAIRRTKGLPTKSWRERGWRRYVIPNVPGPGTEFHEVHVYVPRALNLKIEKCAADEKTTVGAIVRRALAGEPLARITPL